MRLRLIPARITEMAIELTNSVANRSTLSLSWKLSDFDLSYKLMYARFPDPQIAVEAA